MWGQALPSASSPSGGTARSRPMRQERERAPRSEQSPQAGTRRSIGSMLRPRSPAASWRTGFSKNMSDRRERRTPRKATAPASEATSSRRSGSVKPSWSRPQKSPSYTCLCGIGRIRRTASWQLSAACTPLPPGGVWCPAGLTPRSASSDFTEAKRERFLGTEELKRLGETLRLAETEGLPWLLNANTRASKHLAKELNQRTVFAPEVALAFRLLLFTGARLREILHLEWAHVDLERGLLLLPDSKTGRKTIVLSAPALALLQEADRSSAFVVPGATQDQPRSDLKKPWRAIQQHSGLSGVHIHDLRHTFASVGAGSSLGLPIVGKLLGHSQSATTARYAHLDADPLREPPTSLAKKSRALWDPNKGETHGEHTKRRALAMAGKGVSGVRARPRKT